MRIQAIITNNIWIEFQASTSDIVVICTITCSWISLSVSLVHMHILNYSTISSSRRVDDVAWQKCTFIQVCSCSGYPNRLLSRRVELNHHRTIHFSSIHVVDALHAHQILLIVLALDVHHVLVTRILMLSLTVVQMLVDRNVLQMVLILLLAAKGELCALVKLIGITFPRDVHHYEILTQLVLVRDVVEPH